MTNLIKKAKGFHRQNPPSSQVTRKLSPASYYLLVMFFVWGSMPSDIRVVCLGLSLGLFHCPGSPPSLQAGTM